MARIQGSRRFVILIILKTSSFSSCHSNPFYQSFVTSSTGPWGGSRRSSGRRRRRRRSCAGSCGRRCCGSGARCWTAWRPCCRGAAARPTCRCSCTSARCLFPCQSAMYLGHTSPQIDTKSQSSGPAVWLSSGAVVPTQDPKSDDELSDGSEAWSSGRHSPLHALPPPQHQQPGQLTAARSSSAHTSQSVPMTCSLQSGYDAGVAQTAAASPAAQQPAHSDDTGNNPAPHSRQRRRLQSPTLDASSQKRSRQQVGSGHRSDRCLQIWYKRTASRTLAAVQQQ